MHSVNQVAPNSIRAFLDFALAYTCMHAFHRDRSFRCASECRTMRRTEVSQLPLSLGKLKRISAWSATHLIG